MKQPPTKLALTRAETAYQLGISLRSLDRLTSRQLLRPSVALRRPLYPVAEIRRFLAETTAEVRSP
jgi:hypothetical protein